MYPCLLIRLGFIFIAIASRVNSYAIPFISDAATTYDYDLFSPVAPISGLQLPSDFGDDLSSTTSDLEPLSDWPLPVKFGDVLPLTSDSDPPFGSTSPSAVGDDDNTMLASADILSSAPDSLSSNAGSLLSPEHSLSPTLPNLVSFGSTLPSSMLDSLSSTADTTNSNPDLLSSSSYDFHPIDNPASGKDDGSLIASVYEAPHCDDGVALCCSGLRILDGALVEHCSPCKYSKSYIHIYI